MGVNINAIINCKNNLQRYKDFIAYYKIAKQKGLHKLNAVEYAQVMTANIFY